MKVLLVNKATTCWFLNQFMQKFVLVADKSKLSMEKRIFGFLFFTRSGFLNIKEILRYGKYESGENGSFMLTSVHHWLKEEKQINEVFSEPFVSDWGLGFRLSALKKMGLWLQWYEYKNNDKLILVKIPSHSAIDFSMLNPKRDVVVLCPSLKERKQYFEVEERYKSSNRSFPIWHWMSISKNDILDYDRDDENIDSYLRSQFNVFRNYRDIDPLLQEEALF